MAIDMYLEFTGIFCNVTGVMPQFGVGFQFKQQDTSSFPIAREARRDHNSDSHGFQFKWLLQGFGKSDRLF